MMTFMPNVKPETEIMRKTDNVVMTDDMTTTDEEYLCLVYEALGNYLMEAGGLYFDAHICGTIILFSARKTWEGTVLNSVADGIGQMLWNMQDLEKPSPRAHAMLPDAQMDIELLIPEIGIADTVLTMVYIFSPEDLCPIMEWYPDALDREDEQKSIYKSIEGRLRRDFTQGEEPWRLDEEVKVASWQRALGHETKRCMRNFIVNNVICPEMVRELQLNLIGINENLTSVARCTCVHYSFELTDEVATCISDLIRKAGPKAVMVNIPLFMENTDKRAMLGILIEDYVARIQAFKVSNEAMFRARAEIFFYVLNDGHDAAPIFVNNPPKNFQATPSGVANVSYAPLTTAEQDTFALEFQVVVLATLAIEAFMQRKSLDEEVDSSNEDSSEEGASSSD